jgi:hypothetical protein
MLANIIKITIVITSVINVIAWADTRPAPTLLILLQFLFSGSPRTATPTVRFILHILFSGSLKERPLQFDFSLFILLLNVLCVCVCVCVLQYQGFQRFSFLSYAFLPSLWF